MSSRVPTIKVYSPTSKKSRFTWHLPKPEVRQPKTHQIPRFFGTQPTNPKKDSYKSVIQMVKWENTFNMRAKNLDNFPCGSNCRGAYRSQVMAMQRARLGFVSCTSKSLDILRQNLQKSINKEIDEILQKYLQKFFKIAVENIKENNGESSVTDHHIQAVCRQILEEAKAMYQSTYAPGISSQNPPEVSEPERHTEPKTGVTKQQSKKRKDSDSDSEANAVTYKPRKKRGRQPLHYLPSKSGRSTPLKTKAESLKREGPKWNPDRLTTDTEFIMGAKANKALGLGATRGRLYIKHPDIFKYSGDQDDKQWLYDHNLMPATGGKSYVLLVKDILELAESEEYRNSPTLMKDEIVGFTVPEFMVQKMKTLMKEMRTDPPARKRGRPAGSTNSNNVEIKPVHIKTEVPSPVESRAATPSDELDLLNTEIPSTNPSPYSLGTNLDDASPSRLQVSPALSDMSTNLEPPLSAPFDVSNTS